jgi:hypothetical protein
MPIQQLVNNVENKRPWMDLRRGMRHKYMRSRSDPADTASRSVAALEHTKFLTRFLPRELAPDKVFDCTSLNLSL